MNEQYINIILVGVVPLELKTVHHNLSNNSVVSVVKHPCIDTNR